MIILCQDISILKIGSEGGGWAIDNVIFCQKMWVGWALITDDDRGGGVEKGQKKYIVICEWSPNFECLWHK